MAIARWRVRWRLRRAGPSLNSTAMKARGILARQVRLVRVAQVQAHGRRRLTRRMQRMVAAMMVELCHASRGGFIDGL